MQAILCVSNMAAQEIMEHLGQMFLLSGPLLKNMNEMLKKYCSNVSETAPDELVSVVIGSNVFVNATA